jgi:hypothetical protein
VSVLSFSSRGQDPGAAGDPSWSNVQRDEVGLGVHSLNTACCENADSLPDKVAPFGLAVLRCIGLLRAA